MFYTVSGAAAFALLGFIATATGHAASRNPAATVPTAIAKDLGVPSKPQAAPLRILSSYLAKRSATSLG